MTSSATRSSSAGAAERVGPVLVLGSANIDVSALTARLPHRGETVVGHGSILEVGGKGANQAVAAAASGARAQFAGRVGADAFGAMVRDSLRARSVDIPHLGTCPDAATGLAVICVEDSSQNCIIVVPGANDRLAAADLDELEPSIREAAVLVLQCEIPLAVVYRAIELAAGCGTPVILNPAPFRGLDLPRIAGVSYLVPNETEAGQIRGRPVTSVAEAGDCALALRAEGVDCVIITLGAQGCLVADGDSVRHLPGHRVAALDTTGAGDAFVGCLAAALALGRSREESIRRALLYSALSTTRRGAQVSFPAHDEFERAWAAGA